MLILLQSDFVEFLEILLPIPIDGDVLNVLPLRWINASLLADDFLLFLRLQTFFWLRTPSQFRQPSWAESKQSFTTSLTIP